MVAGRGHIRRKSVPDGGRVERMSEPIPKKSLGQHWLYDQPSLEAMVAAADIGPGDTVLEIGPGLGTLTEHLVSVAERVIAVEFDQRLAQELPSRVEAANLTVYNQDILRFDLTQLPAGYKVVANIPYYLTSNLVRMVSESANPPQQVAILIQKEVAERIAAKPGDMSLLSVTAQYFWHVSLSKLVPAELFTPPPRVDSQIVRLQWRGAPMFAADGTQFDQRAFFRLCKAGFGERRKTLRNSLSGGLHLDKAIVEAMLHTVGIDPGLRAQNLTLEQWHSLYRAWREYIAGADGSRNSM